jgi:hypothetical protein
MRRSAPQDRILAILRRMSPVEAQNRLLRLSDGVLALSLIYMADWQHDFVLGFVGSEKARRVRTELERQLRSRVLYNDYLAATETVIAALEGGTSVSSRRYYRPHRPRPTRDRR